MSEDIQKESTSPQPEKQAPDGADRPQADAKPPPYPKTVVAAGVLMLIFTGMWVLLGLEIALSEPGRWASWRGFLLQMWPVPILLFAVIRFMRGKHKIKDARWVGWVCIGIGVLTGVAQPATLALVLFPQSSGWSFYDVLELWTTLILMGAMGAAAVSAGVLLWIGRAPYRAWRMAKDTRQAGAPPKVGAA